MSLNSISMAIIPYTPPKTPMEFIVSEVKRGLKNGSVSLEQIKSVSMAIIPYTPPKTPMEFIISEVERGLKNNSVSLEQIKSVSIPPSIPPSISPISMAKIFRESSDSDLDDDTLDEYLAAAMLDH